MTHLNRAEVVMIHMVLKSFSGKVGWYIYSGYWNERDKTNILNSMSTNKDINDVGFEIFQLYL